MACGCNGAKNSGSTKYKLTRTDGTTTVYNTMTEARIALQSAGGGQITTIAT